MDEFDDSGLDTTGLLESLASNATQAYETTPALNANPLNTALVYGGTPQGGYGSPVPTSGVSGTALLLILGAFVVGGIAISRM